MALSRTRKNTIDAALRVGIPGSTLIACMFLAGEAHALPFCDDVAINPPLTTPLIVQSGDTQEPMLRAMSQKLRNSAVQQQQAQQVAFFLYLTDVIRAEH